VCIPQATLDIGIAGGFEVEEDSVLASGAESVKRVTVRSESSRRIVDSRTDSDKKWEISAKVGSFSTSRCKSSLSASSAVLAGWLDLTADLGMKGLTATHLGKTPCSGWETFPHRRRPSDGYG
jgi:hypothetical protein